MRVVVAGATGYVGSRLVPELLRRGHDVVAATSSEPAPDRSSWGDDVAWSRTPSSRDGDWRRALAGADALCWLVHALDRPGFAAHDAALAATARMVADDAGVARTVYLSGLVPDAPRHTLSPHLSSRLEVEEILAEGSGSSLAVRAGVVVGAGSTSFEVLRQAASLLYVQAVPPFMRSLVQPIGVGDVVGVLATALDDDRTGHVDVGAPEVVTYAQLLGLYCDLAGVVRLQVAVPDLPLTLAARAAPFASAAPWHTVTSLVRSLDHDLVCRDDATADLLGRDPLSVVDALRRSLREPVDPYEATTPGGDPYVSAASDPSWSRTPGPAFGGVPVPTPVRGVLHVVEHRLRGLLGA